MDRKPRTPQPVQVYPTEWRIIWPDGTESYHSYRYRYEAEWASKRDGAYWNDKAAKSMTDDQWLSCLQRELDLENALPDLAAQATTKAEYRLVRAIRKEMGNV